MKQTRRDLLIAGGAAIAASATPAPATKPVTEDRITDILTRAYHSNNVSLRPGSGSRSYLTLQISKAEDEELRRLALAERQLRQ